MCLTRAIDTMHFVHALQARDAIGNSNFCIKTYPCKKYAYLKYVIMSLLERMRRLWHAIANEIILMPGALMLYQLEAAHLYALVQAHDAGPS